MWVLVERTKCGWRGGDRWRAESPIWRTATDHARDERRPRNGGEDFKRQLVRKTPSKPEKLLESCKDDYYCSRHAIFKVNFSTKYKICIRSTRMLSVSLMNFQSEHSYVAITQIQNWSVAGVVEAPTSQVLAQSCVPLQGWSLTRQLMP